MNIGYNTKDRLEDRIGREIREFRRAQDKRREQIARDILEYLQSRNEIGRLSLNGINLYLQRIECGDLYGQTSHQARKGERGKINLRRLSLYLYFLQVPKDHKIVNSIKEFDNRFNYPIEDEILFYLIAAHFPLTFFVTFSVLPSLSQYIFSA